MTIDLATNSEPAQRGGSIWDYVSPSRLNLWLKCPLAFKLRYVDGQRTPPSPAAFVGKMVHLGLEHFYRHRQLGLPLTSADVSGHVSGAWGQAAADEEVVFASAAAEDNCGKQAQDLLFAYFAKLLPAEPLPLAVEVPVESALVDPQTGEDLGIPLLGVIDLVLPGTGGALIADFKTAARGGPPLEDMHEIQLSSYAYLFRRVVACRCQWESRLPPAYNVQLLASNSTLVAPTTFNLIGNQDNQTQVAGRHQMQLNTSMGGYYFAEPVREPSSFVLFAIGLAAAGSDAISANALTMEAAG